MTATASTDPPHLDYGIAEDGTRYVANPTTGIWGAGPTALDALQDYDLAVDEHADLERRLRPKP